MEAAWDTPALDRRAESEGDEEDFFIDELRESGGIASGEGQRLEVGDVKVAPSQEAFGEERGLLKDRGDCNAAAREEANNPLVALEIGERRAKQG